MKSWTWWLIMLLALVVIVDVYVTIVRAEWRGESVPQWIGVQVLIAAVVVRYTSTRFLGNEDGEGPGKRSARPS